MGFGSFLKKAAGIGLAPVTGGASLLLMGDNLSGGTPGGAYQPTDPVTASKIGLPAGALGETFSKIGGAGTGNINQNYATAGTARAGELNALGRGPASNSYGAQRMGAQQALDRGNFNSGLYGELGSTAYKDVNAQRDFNQNMILADEIARASKPSKMDEIFSSIGSAGQAGGKFAPLFKSGLRNRITPTYPLITSNDAGSYYNTGDEYYA